MDYRTLFLVMLVMAAVLLAGCTGQSSKASPEKKSSTVDAGEKNSGQSVVSEDAGLDAAGGEKLQSDSQETMPLNDTINIYLKENPTTGFQWNATVTSGLRIENDTYVADPVKPGVGGSGGMHYWLVRGIAKGNQTFDAIYMRSWEPITGNESRYTMNILVV
jgi:inhibitor of cysteine peptidase